MKTISQEKIPLDKDNITTKTAKVFIIHPINKIKKKVGSFTSEKVLFRNTAIVDASKKDKQFTEKANTEVVSIIQNLFSLWKTIQEKDSNTMKCQHSEKMFQKYINRLYELSLQFSLDTIEELSESLKIFIEDANTQNINHRIIIKAHLDVIKLSDSQNITSKNCQEFKQLREILTIAIQENI